MVSKQISRRISLRSDRVNSQHEVDCCGISEIHEFCWFGEAKSDRWGPIISEFQKCMIFAGLVTQKVIIGDDSGSTWRPFGVHLEATRSPLGEPREAIGMHRDPTGDASGSTWGSPGVPLGPTGIPLNPHGVPLDPVGIPLCSVRGPVGSHRVPFGFHGDPNGFHRVPIWIP